MAGDQLQAALNGKQFIRFPPNPHFVGHQTLLKDLGKLLLGRNDCPRVALHGLGGVGKTQVALAFAHEVAATHPDCCVLWVAAVSEDDVEQSYQGISRRLKIKVPGGKEFQTIESVHEHLSQRLAGRWLLIVDNLDAPRLPLILSNGELPFSMHGAVLITTRTREIATTYGNDGIIELHGMEPCVCEEMFSRSLTNEKLIIDEPSATADLLKELAHLPLAVSQAAAYINKFGISISEYHGLIRSDENTQLRVLSQEFADSQRYLESRNAIAVTWHVSFRQIQSEDEITIEVLSIIACIAPTDIPHVILSDDEAIAKLCAYTFLTQQPGSQIYDTHPLVRLAARKWLRSESDFPLVQSQVVAHLCTLFPWPNHENQYLCRILTPHARVVVDENRGAKTITWLRLNTKVGSFLHREGHFKEALHYFTQGEAWARFALPENDTDRLTSECKLAGACRNTGQLKKAIKLLEHVSQVQGAEQVAPCRQAATQALLATVYTSSGQLDKAIELLETVVRVQSCLPEDNEDRLQSRHSLASAYSTIGQHEKATEILEPVVQIRSALLAEDHPYLLTSQHELAHIYHCMGRVQEATELLEHVVKVREKTLRVDNAARLASQHELARAYMKTGRVEESIEILLRVVAVREDLAGLGSKEMLAMAYFERGHVDEAITLVKRVIGSYKEILPASHPDIVRAEGSLRCYLRSQETMVVC